MADYSEEITLALELIHENGAEVTFRHKTTAPDPVPGEGYPEIIEDQRILVVRTNPTADEIASGAVQADDMILLVAGGDLKSPDASDTVIIDDLEWGIKRIRKVAPAGVPILYKIQIRIA